MIPFHRTQLIPNLARNFSLLSSATSGKHYECSLLKVQCDRPSERSLHKRKVEVAKRIKWVRPPYIPSINPKKTGDLSPLPKIDLKAPPAEFLLSEEYKTASDVVKRVFSLEFQSREKRRDAEIAAVTEDLKRHNLDERSVEVKIGRWTAIIRNMQQHYSRNPKDKKAKADLKELIEFRKKRMKLLRKTDYKLFEWLLEKLDIIYRPHPPKYMTISRKYSIRCIVDTYCENLVNQKLKDYRELLDSQKEDFLRRKIAVMKSVIAEEKDYGVEPSFTEEDIAKEEERLKCIVAENASKLVIEEEA